MIDVEKVIKGLEWCIRDDGDCSHPERCECPYLPGPHHRDCMEEMMLDALALLKEREPRVMTLEEVKQHNNQNGCVWFERQTYNAVAAFVRQDVECTEIISPYILVEPFNHGYWTNGNYNIKWRCWTSRPTEEQRKRARWDDTLVL